MHMCVLCACRRAAFDERVRQLEDAVGSRDRTLVQMRDSLLQADMEYKKVQGGPSSCTGACTTG